MRQLLLDKYDHVCGVVLKIAHNNACAKNPHIQKALLLVLPKLAAFQRDKFVAGYLFQTVNYTDKLLQVHRSLTSFLILRSVKTRQFGHSDLAP
jgi:hypothetical protein